MIAIRKILRMLGADQRGATAIEYGLIAALIIVAMMGGPQLLGGGTGAMWGKLRPPWNAAARRPNQPRRVPNTTSLTFWPGTRRLFVAKPFNDRNRSSLKSR